MELCLTLVLLMACLATLKKFEKMDFQYFFNIISIPFAFMKRFFFLLLFHPIIILESWFVLLKTLQVKTVITPFSLHTDDEKNHTSD